MKFFVFYFSFHSQGVWGIYFEFFGAHTTHSTLWKTDLRHFLNNFSHLGFFFIIFISTFLPQHMFTYYILWEWRVKIVYYSDKYRHLLPTAAFLFNIAYISINIGKKKKFIFREKILKSWRCDTWILYYQEED